MKTKKIKMMDSRRIAGHGLKNTGEVWSPPLELGEQLCQQKFAVPVNPVDALSELSRKKPQSKGD